MKNLLKKWLGGATTWQKEKQLRRASQKDDFLAEAIEGYDAFPNQDHTTTIRRLKTNCHVIKHKKKGWFFICFG